MSMVARTVHSPFHQEVARRFGLVPNFFMSARDAPEIVEKLWDFAKSAYLDSPMPSLFKERLFVFLSRFCPVRYCIIRHCGFLVGCGHSSGDPATRAQKIDEVLILLRAPRLGGDSSSRFMQAWRQSRNRSTGPLPQATWKIGYSRLRL